MTQYYSLGPDFSGGFSRRRIEKLFLDLKKLPLTYAEKFFGIRVASSLIP